MPGSFTQLYVHAIFSTKHRAAAIRSELRGQLYPYITGIIENNEGAMIEIGGTEDHVHMLFRIHPSTAIADLIRLVKSNSSKWINDKPERNRRFEWQSGYGAFTVSASAVDSVREYIRNQEAHHRNVSFQEEFVAFLKRHGIEYDERYIWE